MKKLIAILILITFYQTISLAAQYSDKFANCLMQKTTERDKIVLVRWAFSAMAHHSALKEEFNIPLHNKIFNRFFRCNFSKQKSKFLFNLIPLNSKVISFTDWDSINVALHHNYRKDLKLICGFHGLINFFSPYSS